MNCENYCFCELAPLYALDLLSEAQKLWLEQQLLECPELVEELAQYELGATAIAYSAPLVSMNNLKERLFDSLDLELPSPESISLVENKPETLDLTVRAQDLQWQPHLVPGIEIAILQIDPLKREIVGLLRAAPGASYPLHRHAQAEEIYLLEGDLAIQDEVYGAGDYIHSQPGSSHAPFTKGGCKFFFRASMDDEYPDIDN